MQHSEFYKKHVLLTGNNNEVREGVNKKKLLVAGMGGVFPISAKNYGF